MRWLLCSLLLLTACSTDVGDDDDTVDDDTVDDDVADDDVADDDDEDTHPVGMAIPPFSLEDLNPSSATYGQLISSDDLLGSPYALIFLDSRCVACAEVADALWASFVDHPGWWVALPTFAVESPSAIDNDPDSIDEVVDGNDLPYLADTWDTALWQGMSALNHDFFAVSAEGTLETWLPLYVWPDNLDDYLDYMTDNFGS